MSRVLVLGDYICDQYRHFTATRLCPEGPVPVLVKTKEDHSTAGGAGLVAAQLTELFGDPISVVLLSGSYSVKERIFADDRLMLRMDEDAVGVDNDHSYLHTFPLDGIDAIIISDYDKGSFTLSRAVQFMSRANRHNIPVFVDAKNNWEWYEGAYAAFPNAKESEAFVKTRGHEDVDIRHWIVKDGANGCFVDGVHIPSGDSHPVKDVTGAGDVFIAAFVYQWLTLPLATPSFTTAKGFSDTERLVTAARVANRVAGLSVEFVGTHVVTRKELDSRGYW